MDELVKWEYLCRPIRDGRSAPMNVELNELGAAGWEFCAWVDDWNVSEGPAPDSRAALFKRRG